VEKYRLEGIDFCREVGEKAISAVMNFSMFVCFNYLTVQPAKRSGADGAYTAYGRLAYKFHSHVIQPFPEM
jgi:hypothetical protein